MAASAVITDQGSSQSTGKKSYKFDPAKYPFVRRWSDAKRVSQRTHLASDKLTLQYDERYGMAIRSLAAEAHRNLPKKARIDLPSQRAFTKVLGFLRTCATLKKHKLGRLELGAKDIAELLNLSKTTVESVLRWLSCAPIVHHGQQISRGIGIIHRCRRTGAAFVKGKLRQAYRTSIIVLTEIGKGMLRIVSDDDKKKILNNKKKTKKSNNQPKPKVETKVERHSFPELEHIQGHGDDGGGKPLDGDSMTPEVGHHWLNKIKERL